VENAILNLLTRIEIIKDKVDDLAGDVRSHMEHGQRTDLRIQNLETASININDSLYTISDDLKKIKEGPIYSLDQYIKRKVASYTMGLSTFGFFCWIIFFIFVN
jgi:hypothetical protein